MNNLTVKKLQCSKPRPEEIPSLMAANGIQYYKVECVNWPDQFPYRPDVEFGIAHCDDAILLHFRVGEQSVRAVAEQDNQNIWEDSCVEFFVSPEDDGTYYNIECNCAGHLLVGSGRVKPDRERSSMEVMHAVERWASLGSTPFDIREQPTTWEVALCIPLSTFFLHHVTSLSGQTFRANFYKCGDLLPVPHFLSWNAIASDKPNFHRPDCFGELRFL